MLQLPDENNLEKDVDSRVFNLYEKREKIYTRKMEGFFQKVRLYTGWPLLLAYFGVPWLTVEGHQAVLFDLPERKFHIFWLTFWPQDFGLLAWALMIAAFLLFFLTTLFGRVWCGYTCPQTVWTAIFMWAEQLTEGDRHQRINLDHQPWNLQKVLRRTLKHGMWLGFAALTGVTFIGYFYGLPELIVDAATLDLPLVAGFWTAFFTATTYINAGWMREQVCIYMCPYARFQSAMFDEDTLIVSYDESRGEPRGPRKRSADHRALGLGDCIDCTMCVQVCPTGIDIRDGLQYECINCAHCIDACDSIMDKMGYPRGLISYTTENKLKGKSWTWKRPKLIGYGLAALILVSGFTWTVWSRVPLELDVIRGRGQLFQEVAGGRVQNTYMVKVLNMDTNDHRYELSVSGLPSPSLSPDEIIDVEAGEIAELSVSVRVNPDRLETGNVTIEFVVEALDANLRARTESRFIGPKPLGDK